jgi:putative DNA primase/helicase
MVTRDPDDANRRLLLPVKNNLAPLGKGFAFRLEQRIVDDPGKSIVASSVVWESSPIDITADAALQAADANANGSASAGNEAEEFLKEILAGGPIPQREIEAAAKGNGLAWATVRRAKKRLGVKAIKDGMEGGWLWDLPKMLTFGEDARLKRMSAFGSDEHLRGNGTAGSSVLEHDDGSEISRSSRANPIALRHERGSI